ncbi:MAG: phosphate/phosphite/phosphonate ABC transporter substrate-binding protein [Thermodesulfovibrionales bacterium]
MNMRFLKTICLIFALLACAGCTGENDPKRIDTEKKETIPPPAVKTAFTGNLRVAVGGMITPKQGFGYYRDFLDYIGRKTGRHIDFVDREDYAEINRLVQKGEVDLAFVCGGPYVDGHRDFGMEILAAPRAYGDTVYYSYIIVHKDSPFLTFDDLRGKRFAFTDPLSNTGKLAPTFMLAKRNETPESFFRSTVFTKSHDKSIKAVAQKIVDAAAVDSLIWEYENRTNPEFTSKTRIIEKSPPYGIPPVVVRHGIDPQLKEQLRAVFLNAHLDPDGRKILDGMMIEKFVVISDSAYDSIRAMKDWVDRQQRARTPKAGR